MVEEKNEKPNLYRNWKKEDLVEKVRALELIILELKKDLKEERNIKKWEGKMELEELKKDKFEMHQVNIKIPKECFDFIQKHNLSLQKIVMVAVEELKKQV